MASADSRRALVTGRGIPLCEDDVDTDRIIPARYMKGVSFDGLGEHAFHDARRDAAGTLIDHPFNDSRFVGASILVVNRNFGCGSSREHAPQALARAGITALVGESFAEIFAGNCVTLGMVAARVSAADAKALQDLVEKDPTTSIEIDLGRREVRAAGKAYALSLPESQLNALVTGTWDSTGALLANEALIAKTAASLPYMGWKTAG
ncbi:MAG: 3-isopropylmalate dehydratase small subunit [Rectinemataceae bacterium]